MSQSAGQTGEQAPSDLSTRCGGCRVLEHTPWYLPLDEQVGRVPPVPKARVTHRKAEGPHKVTSVESAQFGSDARGWVTTTGRDGVHVGEGSASVLQPHDRAVWVCQMEGHDYMVPEMRPNTSLSLLVSQRNEKVLGPVSVGNTHDTHLGIQNCTSA